MSLHFESEKMIFHFFLVLTTCADLNEIIRSPICYSVLTWFVPISSFLLLVIMGGPNLIIGYRERAEDP